MLLSDWLARKGVTRTKFAEMIGVTPSHITGLCQGVTCPSLKIALAIEEKTNGEVTPGDFARAGTNPEAAD